MEISMTVRVDSWVMQHTYGSEASLFCEQCFNTGFTLHVADWRLAKAK